MWVPGRQTGNPCSCLPDPSATWPTNAAQASRAACAANGSEHKRQTGSDCMIPAPIHCGREGDGHSGDPPMTALLPFRKDGQTDESLHAALGRASSEASVCQNEEITGDDNAS